MSRPLTRPEVAELAADLRAMLEKIETGEVDATIAMHNPLEGAIAVLDVSQGRTARFNPE